MKITERDKILLVLLAVILVVALAVILPGVGVMACNDAISEAEVQIQQLNGEIEKLKPELTSRGVTLSVADHPTDAADLLVESTWDLKEEASRLADNIMAYTPLDSVEGWVRSPSYRYGIVAPTEQPLVTYQFQGGGDSGLSENPEDKIFVLDDMEYVLKSVNREISCTLNLNAECMYTVANDYVLESYAIEKGGALFLYLDNLASKGSLLINEIDCKELLTEDESPTTTISYTLLMTATEGISTYEQQVNDRKEQLKNESEE